MKKFTNCLKNNEVYFTTICTITLSIMAIIVSIVSVKVAKRQSQMDYFDKQPDFQLIKKQILNKSTDKYETILDIYKVSGKAKNIEVQDITLLNIEYQNSNKAKKNSKFLTNNFYGTTFISNDYGDLILSLAGNNNNSNTVLLEKYFEEMIEDSNQFLNFEWNSYIEIRYLDFELESKIEYFDISSNRGKIIKNDSLSKYFGNKNLFTLQNTINLYNINDRKKMMKYLKNIK